MENSDLSRLISGALFDFCGYLTSLPKGQEFTVGAAHLVPPLVKALECWAETRGLSLDDAAVKGWQDALTLRKGDRDGMTPVWLEGKLCFVDTSEGDL